MADTARSNVATAWSTSPGQRLRLGQPEGAQQEGALLPGQPVLGQVQVHQAALVGQPIGGRVDGRLHPRVVPGQEPGDHQHQVRGIQVLAAERLGERPRLLVPAVLQDGRPDLIPLVDERREHVAQPAWPAVSSR
jgi:hypothetical protein